MSNGKDHLDTDRLDQVTILPPPGPSCKITLGDLRSATLLGQYLHNVQKHGLPSFECSHPECVVDAVHDH